jgi:hypothetical protein
MQLPDDHFAGTTAALDAPPPGLPRTSFGRVLLAPWLAIFRPAAAARVLVGGTRPAAVAACALGLLSCAAALLFAMAWHDTSVFIAVPSGPSPSSAPAYRVEVQTRSFAQVWDHWHSGPGGWFGDGELTIVLVVVLGLVLLAGLAWLNLPLVHATGPLGAAFERSWRVGVAWLGPLALAMLVCGAVAVQANYDQRGVTGPRNPRNDPAFAMFRVIAPSVVYLLLWLRRAAGAVQPQTAIALPPRCEGCGYDLTHQPADGRCTECGLEMAASLDEGRSRPRDDWHRRHWLRDWVRTLGAVLVRPSGFYRTLKLRTPDAPARRFAAFNYVAIAFLAAVWMLTLFAAAVCTGNADVIFEAPDAMVAFWATVAGCYLVFGVCACWFGHRAVGALVFTVWLLKRELADYRWAAKVLAYETAYLWVFCAFWGVMFTSFMAWGMWLSDWWAPGRRAVFLWGFPLEMLAVFAGTIGLFVIWLWRYRIAYRAIRWSNF